MVNDIYDPLKAYKEIFRNRFKTVAEETFAQLAAEAHVDTEANQATCSQLYESDDSLKDIEERINQWCLLRQVLLICSVSAPILAFFFQDEYGGSIMLLSILFSLILLTIMGCLVNPRLKELRQNRDGLASKVDELRKEAWKQMEPLNRLYDWDVFSRMVMRTVPRIEFDPYFTAQRLADLQHTYGWNDSFNTKRSVVYAHSGLINGNPFVICRTRKITPSKKTYKGSKTISWTTRERDANGRMQTVRHSEVLHASIKAFYPLFQEESRLIYGNTAAPDLTFHRNPSGLAAKIGSLAYLKERRELRKKARDLKDNDFAMLTNEEFEVVFNTSNRNNNHQYALLFTPLAQNAMMDLLKDKNFAYGDDFSFTKDKMINTIIPEHLQELKLDMNPANYHRLDFREAQEDFYSVNAEQFRAIYFTLAPLLCVPMYQQIRPVEALYDREMQHQSAFWEHEALANFWGYDHFKHPDCATSCILKTTAVREADGTTTITVTAHGYRIKKRVSYVDCWGGDGKYHSVPVHWNEYIPISGEGYIEMIEDNQPVDATASHSERLEHIQRVLHDNELNLYRRHIASSVLK